MVPFWIQIYKIPLDLLSIRNARAIGEKLGVLLRVEDPFEDDVGRGFLRVHVLIDLKKPLLESLKIPRSDGGSIKAYLRYEKLQNYCYFCGKLGHIVRSCATPVRANDKACRYETDMRVTAIRYSMTVRRSDISDRKEVGGDKTKEEKGARPEVNMSIDVEITLQIKQKNSQISTEVVDIQVKVGASSDRGKQKEKPTVSRKDMAAEERMRAGILAEENAKLKQLMYEMTKEWSVDASQEGEATPSTNQF